MSAHDEAVEAAALAAINTRRARAGAPPVTPEVAGWLATAPQRQGELEAIDAAITAYLRHMRAAGFVVTQEMEEKPPASAANNEFWRGFYAGWNEYRSRTLANAVEVPE